MSTEDTFLSHTCSLPSDGDFDVEPGASVMFSESDLEWCDSDCTCASAGSQQASNSKMRSHKRSRSSNSSSNPAVLHCSKHIETPAISICLPCAVAFCAHCSDFHKLFPIHKSVGITEALSSMCSVLHSELQKVPGAISTIVAFHDKVQAEKSSASTRLSESLANYDLLVDECIASINQTRENVKAEMRDAVDAAVKGIEALIDELAVNVGYLQGSASIVERFFSATAGPDKIVDPVYFDEWVSLKNALVSLSVPPRIIPKSHITLPILHLELQAFTEEAGKFGLCSGPKRKQLRIVTSNTSYLGEVQRLQSRILEAYGPYPKAVILESEETECAVVLQQHGKQWTVLAGFANVDPTVGGVLGATMPLDQILEVALRSANRRDVMVTVKGRELGVVEDMFDKEGIPIFFTS